MSPEIITDRTENIAIVILVVFIFALAFLLFYFIKQTTKDKESERTSSQEVTDKMIALLEKQVETALSQKQMLKIELAESRAENRCDRDRYEENIAKISKEHSEALNSNTSVLQKVAENMETIPKIQESIEKIKQDVEELKMRGVNSNG